MKEKSNLPRYEEPKITTYTSEDILEVIGPVQAATGSGYLDLEGGGLTGDRPPRP